MKPKLYVCNCAGEKWCPLCSRGKVHPKLPGCGSNDCEFATDRKVHLVKCIPVRRKPDPLGRGLAKRLSDVYMNATGREGEMPHQWSIRAVAREVRRICREVRK